MAPGRRDGLRSFRRAVARRARPTDWLADFLRRHATFKTYKTLHVEELEERLVWNASALSELISPEWFEDCGAASETAHAGAAGWSAAAKDETRASVGGAADTYDWIVRFDTAALGGITSAAGTTSLLVGSGIHFDVLRGLGLVGQVLVRSSGASPDEVRGRLSADKDVAGFEQDEVHQFAVLPNDPRRSELWGLDNAGDTDIDALAAWNLTTGSRNVVVAVVDTGVDYNHPDLAANIWTNPREIVGNGIDDDGNGFVDDVHGYNFADNTSDPMDDQSHGTHVSGTIGAVGNNGTGVVGVNWSVSIMALKFLDATGSGYTSDAVRAINYATMMRTRYGVNVRVMNHSWGGPGFSAALHDAIQASGNAGILNAVAAGNDSANVDSAPSYPAAYDCSNMLTVAATTSQDQLASFSNWGTTSVDLAAPGYQILSTVPNGGYATYSGTSMATPHVSGVAALAWALKPDATVAEVRNAILQGVDHLSALNGRVATGGRLNAYNTLQLLTPSGPQAPSISTLSVTPGSMTVGAIATITAGGVVDRDGTVSAVSFYQDANGNGQWDSGDRLLGTDTTIESQTASITLNTAGYAPGSYTVFARAQDNSGQWSSAASASMTLGAPDDHGNDPATATPVSVPSVVRGAIEAGGDQDWFAFQAVAGRSYVFETALSTLSDSVLSLFDRNGTTLLAYNDDWGPTYASRIAWTAPAGGTYYLAVAAYSPSQTGSYALHLSAQNSPPVLAPIADRTMSHSQDTLEVPLQASDPDGDPITFSASAFTTDALAQRAYDLDQQLGLSYVGTYYQNDYGLQEKWMRAGNGDWYCTVPNGELRRWIGSATNMPLVATLSPAYWTDPGLLHSAQAPAPIPVEGVNLSFRGSVLVIDPQSDYVGSFQVRVTAGDGLQTASRTFGASVTNSAPVLAPIGDRTISPSQDFLTIVLSASDADGDPVSYAADLVSRGPLAEQAYALDQQLGLKFMGNYYENDYGLGEKWLRGGDGTGAWYCLLPNGEVRRWTGSVSNMPWVATLSPTYWADPSLLHDASLTQPGDVSLRLDGNVLSIDPRDGFRGSFRVQVSASDGSLSDSESFKVTVANRAPTLAPIADRTIPAGQTAISVNLSATDPDGDRLTYTAQVAAPDPLAQRAYDLDQQLGLYYGGSYYQNLRGYQEKWMRASGGARYCIFPSGQLRRWSGTMSRSPVIATLSPAYYADPRLLHDATLIRPGDVALTLNGATLTISPRSGRTGDFRVQVTASDGQLSGVTSFKVTIGNAASGVRGLCLPDAPQGGAPLAQIAGEVIPDQSRLDAVLVFQQWDYFQGYMAGRAESVPLQPAGQFPSEPSRRIPGQTFDRHSGPLADGPSTRLEDAAHPGRAAQPGAAAENDVALPALAISQTAGDSALSDQSADDRASRRAEVLRGDSYDLENQVLDELTAMIEDVREAGSGSAAADQLLAAARQ